LHGRILLFDGEVQVERDLHDTDPRYLPLIVGFQFVPVKVGRRIDRLARLSAAKVLMSSLPTYADAFFMGLLRVVILWAHSAATTMRRRAGGGTHFFGRAIA